MTTRREPEDGGFDLASLRLGASVIACSDDFFAEKENLLLPHDAEWREDAYTDKGKWMDGWESRRKRHPDGTADTKLHPDFHDWAIVRLGVPGVVRALVVDTSFFRGNFPEACEVWGTALPIDASLEALTSPDVEWTPILAHSPLEGNTKNRFAVVCPYAFTHVKLVIFPDGGVARLRVLGEVVPDWHRRGHAKGELDLAAAEHGGDVLLASDMFFGERRNLVMPGRAANMGDGWETRRRRGPGHDWAIVKLASPAAVTRVEIDTNHFKGNFPDTASLEACSLPPTSEEGGAPLEGADWRPLLDRRKLMAHTRHFFEPELHDVGVVSHVRLSVYPDGGVSRLRVYGELDLEARLALGLRRLNLLPPPEALATLHACAASERWVTTMLAARPFASVAALHQAAERAWATLGPDDFREAMRAHPRIGEQRAEAQRGAEERRWSSKEQSGMAAATDEQRRAMAEKNRAYEERFGFTYIVCATGKSAAELLATIDARLGNDADLELRRAGEELLAIAKLRLTKGITP